MRLFKNIQLRNLQQNLNLKSTNPKKVATKIIGFQHLKKKVTNALWNAFKMKIYIQINKLNWIFNHIFSDHKLTLLLYANEDQLNGVLDYFPMDMIEYFTKLSILNEKIRFNVNKRKRKQKFTAFDGKTTNFYDTDINGTGISMAASCFYKHVLMLWLRILLIFSHFELVMARMFFQI